MKMMSEICVMCIFTLKVKHIKWHRWADVASGPCKQTRSLTYSLSLSISLSLSRLAPRLFIYSFFPIQAKIIINNFGVYVCVLKRNSSNGAHTHTHTLINV